MATVQETIQCCFMYDATKPHMIERKICEGSECLKAALSSGISGLQVIFASATSVGWGEQWSSDIAVSRVLSKCSDIHSENTRFETLWLSPMTRISSNEAGSSLLPLVILKDLSILLGCPIFTVSSCHQDRK